ncbi:MAG: hypothetical protein EHM18_15530, partial [Acidobacteria bacterium]
MKTLLVFPPTADPAHPALGLCSLAAFLRARGKDVSVFDLNVEAHNHLLSSPVLARYSSILRARLEEFETCEQLPREKAEEYRTIAENLLSSDYLIENIDKARVKLREPETYSSLSGYEKVVSVVRRAMELISAAYFPTKWCPGAFSMRYQPTSSRDVLAAIGDRRENLFLEFLERRVSEIGSHNPDVVGISLNYHCQMIPALTVASLVKQHLPSAFIVIGGGLVSFYQERWKAFAQFQNLVDAWIPFEGEKPLCTLIETLESGGRASSVDGVLTFDGKRPAYRRPPAAPKLDDLPRPDFSGLVLQDYLAPEPILPILASRGCYWGKCAFCSHGHLYRRDFRQLTSADVLEMITRLSED